MASRCRRSSATATRRSVSPAPRPGDQAGQGPGPGPIQGHLGSGGAGGVARPGGEASAPAGPHRVGEGHRHARGAPASLAGSRRAAGCPGVESSPSARWARASARPGREAATSRVRPRAAKRSGQVRRRVGVGGEHAGEAVVDGDPGQVERGHGVVAGQDGVARQAGDGGGPALLGARAAMPVDAQGLQSGLGQQDPPGAVADLAGGVEGEAHGGSAVQGLPGAGGAGGAAGGGGRPRRGQERRPPGHHGRQAAARRGGMGQCREPSAGSDGRRRRPATAAGPGGYHARARSVAG